MVFDFSQSTPTSSNGVVTLPEVAIAARVKPPDEVRHTVILRGTNRDSTRRGGGSADQTE